jgi:hypothetical protein
MVAFEKRMPSQDPIGSCTHSDTCSYTITKFVGENPFELSIPPFLVLHTIFNVELLRPYFPPLLTLRMRLSKLAPTELNPNYIK